MIEIQNETLKLKNNLDSLTRQLEEEKDAGNVRELCLRANMLLMEYNRRTWNKIYRGTLPEQPKKLEIAQPEEEIEYDLPPV